MDSVWTHPQQHTQFLALGVELDRDECSEPGSVPLPNEDFEPFFTDYTEYDERLQHTLGRVQDLGIPEHDNYSVFNPSTDSDFVITRPDKGSYNYYENDNSWSSPTKNPPMPPSVWSSPVRPSALAFTQHTSPVKTPLQTGPSPEFFSPGTPLHANRVLFSPTHAPPSMDLPSSPPGSPSLRPTYRPNGIPEIMGVDSLGIRHTTIKEEEPGVSPKEEEELSWQPILTIPVEAQRESDRIIKSQRSMSELKTKRKSCLPPGTVDEFIAGPDDGNYRCLYPHCGRLFRRKYNLKSHIQTHLCDRPYVCESCEATFVRPHDLKRHELCHQSTRHFVCPCGKSFTRMDAMQRHRSRMICNGGLQGSASPTKSPRKRRVRPAKGSSSPHSDSAGSPGDGDSTPTL